MRLIVNADDLGMSLEVNNATFDLIAKDLVTSSTFLANAPAFEDAAGRVHDYPQASFGVHLNLIQFAPLTQSPYLRPLLDQNGQFKRNWDLKVLSRNTATAILEEWSAQIQTVKDAGVDVSHFDSHHLVHNQWRLLRVVKELQKRYNLSRMRTIENLFLDWNSPKRRIGNAKRLAWRFAASQGYPTIMADGFSDFSTIFQLYQREQLPYQTVEAMVHPAHPEFREETQLLQTIDRELMALDWISYWEL